MLSVYNHVSTNNNPATRMMSFFLTAQIPLSLVKHDITWLQTPLFEVTWKRRQEKARNSFFVLSDLLKGSFRLLTSQNLANSQNNSNQGVGVKWTSGGGGGVGEADFAPSDVNDILIDPVPTNTESYPVNVSSTSIDLCDGRNIGLDAAGLPEMPESLPAQPIDVAQPSSPEDANSSFTIISPVEVLPMPKAAHTRQKRKSKRGATAILTSSPYKKQLAATNRSQSAVSGNSSKISSSKKRSMKKAKVSRSSMQQKDTVDENDNNVDAECFYCNELYSKSSENDGWIQCSKCMRWAREACSGCNEEDENFICELCF
ncbi:unnamed protein product [Clavelina lepadiformis]|uniref:Uncharacterized protein n=1 Tax=Clavelina lepadiformis TaxID=159417 RepID=A0ABP0GNM8_CLALP